MLFSELVQNIPTLNSSGSLDCPIEGIAWDSRQVKPGFLFVCLQGQTFDGHDFLGQALERGAAGLVVGSRSAIREARGVPWVQVKNPRRCMAPLAAAFFGHPSKKLQLVGITGTNGKTTTSYLVQSVYEAAGHPAAVMGTTGVRFRTFYRDMEMTTPEAPRVQEILASLVQRGASAAAMEVSSHALAQERVASCRFRTAIFTNLTRDHLDYHITMEEYLRAKTRLFQGPEAYRPSFAVLNADDPAYPYLKARALMPVISYGLGPGAAVRADEVRENRGEAFGQTFQLITPRGSLAMRLNLPEDFNLYNALAAAALGIGEGFTLDVIKQGLEGLKRVPGRLEPLSVPGGFRVVLDYAHTPDALEKALAFLKKQNPRRLLLVFGCPGERDKGKRPLMGRIASRYCDLVVLTADNPAREKASDIINDIQAGVTAASYAIPDRETAVHFALSRAKPGDLILLAGKGHETYQLIGRDRIPYSDRLAVKRFFASGWDEEAELTYPQPGFGGLQKFPPLKDAGVSDKSVPVPDGPHGPSPGSPP